VGWAYLQQGDLTKADTLCEVALQAMRRKPTANPRAISNILTHMGAVRLAQEKYSEAETLLREALPLAQKQWPDAAYGSYVMSLLGGSLAGQKKYAEAEALLLQGFQELDQRKASMPPRLQPTRRITESLERLVELYDAWGKPTKAAEWRKELTEFQQAASAADNKGLQP
jgi:tetratricopeptide (TPR) repeat protein